MPIRIGLACLLLVAAPLTARSQGLPHWNVTLPASPGTSTQKVALTSRTLTIESVFPQNNVRTVVPLKSIVSISKPYLYTEQELADRSEAEAEGDRGQYVDRRQPQ